MSWRSSSDGAQVAPSAETAAASSYERLFGPDPKPRHLFRGDVREQGRMLMQMLAVADDAQAGFDFTIDPSTGAPQFT